MSNRGGKAMQLIRRIAAAIAALAIGVGGAGVAQASHGADDPPGHEAHHHHHHHHHGNDDRGHHHGHHHGGKDDGPNHH
jgi:hypothetical protein